MTWHKLIEINPGSRGIALDWFKSCLRWYFYLTTKGCLWSTSRITILGLCFFLLIYINDLASLSGVIYSLSYADDTSMFISGPKIQELQNELDENLGLRIVSDWLYEKKVSLNVEKMQLQIHGRYLPKHFNIDYMNHHRWLLGNI